jgi:N-acetylmuramoyl-L-alanine amidase
LIAKLEKMAFKNPWGKGTKEFDKWTFSEWLKTMNSGQNSQNENNADENKEVFYSNPDEFFIKKRSEILIYVDPGHVYLTPSSSGNAGAPSIIGYKHKIPIVVDGKLVPQKDDQQKEIEVTTTASEVSNNQDYKYIKDDLEKGPPWEWVTQWIPDISRPEYLLTYKVGQIIYELLLQMGYEGTVISREKEKGPLLNDRIKTANKMHAHYYLSIHSDGDFPKLRCWSEECFALYFPDENPIPDRQKTFADDLMKYYTHSKNNKGAKKAPLFDSYGITNPKMNKSVRRAIVEIGVTTNPIWYDSAIESAADIAKEIVVGLEENINKYFFVQGKEIGYEYQGKLYKERSDIPYGDKSSSNPNQSSPLPFPDLLKSEATATLPTWDQVKMTKVIYEKLSLPAVDIDAALVKALVKIN